MYGKRMKKTPKTAVVRRGKTKPPQDPAEPWFPVSHEKFALDVAGGMTQHDAYIKNICPRAKDWKPSNVDVRASEMARKVKPRINYLRQKSSEKGIATIADRKRRLSMLINGTAKDDLKTRDQIAAIAELNRMEKVYDTAPTASFTIILEKSEWRPN